MNSENPANKNRTNAPDAAVDKDRQAIDRAPGETRGKVEKLPEKNIQGKKIDADPSQESDRPVK